LQEKKKRFQAAEVAEEKRIAPYMEKTWKGSMSKRAQLGEGAIPKAGKGEKKNHGMRVSELRGPPRSYSPVSKKSLGLAERALNPRVQEPQSLRTAKKTTNFPVVFDTGLPVDYHSRSK